MSVQAGCLFLFLLALGVCTVDTLKCFNGSSDTSAEFKKVVCSAGDKHCMTITAYSREDGNEVPETLKICAPECSEELKLSMKILIAAHAHSKNVELAREPEMDCCASNLCNGAGAGQDTDKSERNQDADKSDNERSKDTDKSEKHKGAGKPESAANSSPGMPFFHLMTLASFFPFIASRQ